MLKPFDPHSYHGPVSSLPLLDRYTSTPICVQIHESLTVHSCSGSASRKSYLNNSAGTTLCNSSIAIFRPKQLLFPAPNDNRLLSTLLGVGLSASSQRSGFPFICVETEDPFVAAEDPGVYADDCAGWEEGFVGVWSKETRWGDYTFWLEGEGRVEAEGFFYGYK